MENKTFKLEELDDEFWEKVILINIQRSNGFCGYGSIWIVTSDKKQYHISFETFPYSERNLEEFTPILKRKATITDYAHPYVAEKNGWTYLPKERTLIRDDFYEAFIKTYNYYTEYYKGRGLAILHMPTIAGYALGLEGEPERFYEENAYLLREQRENEEKEREEAQKSIVLTKEDLVWKKLYANNDPNNPQLGEYAFLFKNVEERIVGYKFTILYQYEEIIQLQQSINSPIECYILLEQRVNDIQGPLFISDKTKDDEYPQAFDCSTTLDNYCVNSYGDFIRAFKTPEEAKDYVIDLISIRHYANKWNVVKDISNKEIMYKNWLRKYQGIIAFREHYNEILKIVCDFRFRDRCTGGKYIMDEIERVTKIDTNLLKEVWQYIPLVLTPQTQEKAADIVEECKEFLE